MTETTTALIMELVLLVALVVAAVVMVAATAAEQRFGPAVAGWVGAAPITITIAMFVVGADLGGHAAATLAESSAKHVSAQVVFAMAFVAVVRRHRGLIALLCGTAAYAALSLVIVWVPSAVAIGASLIALVMGPRLLLAGPKPAPVAGHMLTNSATRAVVAAAIVALTLSIARLAGPATAGATAAYPVLSATLALLILRSRGKDAAAQALSGLCRGLPGYFSFCLAMALATPHVGVAFAVPFSLAVCLITYRVTWRTVRPSRVPTPMTEPV
ncbi:MAG: hypothetical protein ACLQVK_19995 [Acidimicrobiales bacterium]